jgi:DNA primase
LYAPDTTKYLIHLYLNAEGVVEKSDVIGAIFGQTEGLLGEDLDLRDLQRTGRVGRIDVQISSKKGETKGGVLISSSLDKAETALLAASLETIDRVGPCNAKVSVERIEDIRITKRRRIAERAKEILMESFDEGSINSNEVLDIVREASRIEKVGVIGGTNIPAGPNVEESDAIIVVEGRADVINLLRYGIKNAVAVEGTNVPETIVKLCQIKTSTAFLDGDRGGDLILSELLQVADIDYIAFAPRGKSVEELARKEIIKALRNKVPVEFVADQGVEPETRKSIPKRQSAEPVAVGENVKKVAGRDGRETGAAGSQEAPLTLQDHAERVLGTGKARLLSPDNSIVGETAADTLIDALEETGGEATGVVIDGVVDQKTLDILVSRGMEYIAASDFQGLVKRPVATRLLKIG